MELMLYNELHVLLIQKGHTMVIDSKMHNALIVFLGKMTAQELADNDLFAVYTALKAPLVTAPQPDSKMVGLYLKVTDVNVQPVEAIRQLTGKGAKETTALWDSLNPNKVAGTFGPIVSYSSSDLETARKHCIEANKTLLLTNTRGVWVVM